MKVYCCFRNNIMFSKLRKVSKIRFNLEEVKHRRNHLSRLISTEEVINREKKYAAHNYHPLPVALSKGLGL